jgi:hypothetical protein
MLRECRHVNERPIVGLSIPASDDDVEVERQYTVASCASSGAVDIGANPSRRVRDARGVSATPPMESRSRSVRRAKPRMSFLADGGCELGAGNGRTRLRGVEAVGQAQTLQCLRSAA